MCRIIFTCPLYGLKDVGPFVSFVHLSIDLVVLWTLVYIHPLGGLISRVAIRSLKDVV